MDDQLPWAVVVTCIVVTVVGLVLALLELHHHPRDWVATSALAVAVGPTLIGVAVVTQWEAVGVTGALTALLLTMLLTLPGLSPRVRGTLLALAAIALFQTTAIAASSSGSLPALLLAEATAFTVLAHRLRSRGVLITAAAYAFVGGVTTLGAVPLNALVLTSDAERFATPQGWLAGVVLVVAALVLVAEVQWSNVLRRPRVFWWFGAAAALYGITATFVLGAVAVLGPDGFVIGHSAATVAWAAIGLTGVALASRAGRVGVEVRVAGLILTAAALVKLLFFDLAALNGFARVAAFLVTGLLLLWRGALVRGTRDADPRPAA